MDFDPNNPQQCDQFHLRQIQEIQQRILSHLDHQSPTTDLTPNSLANPSSFYTSTEQYQWEKDQLFRTTPLLACLSADLPEAGSTFLFDAAGPPIVLTRDNDGVVHGFLNLCRHRGALVCTESGKAARMTCRFHGWTYTLQGKLVGVPGREGFDDIELEQLNLQRVPVREWCGMVFVIASPGDQSIDLESFLGDFAQQLAMLKLNTVVADHKSELHTEANWKLMLDTHGEGYHFASLHPKTIAPNVVSNVSVYDQFGPHFRVAFAQNSHMDLLKQGRQQDDTTNYSAGLHLFPNTVIFLSTFNIGKQPGSVEAASLDTSAFYFGIYRLYPGQHPGETRTLMATYRPQDHSESVKVEEWKATHQFIEQVLIEEDYAMSAEQYKNLTATGSDLDFYYGRNEIGIHVFMNAIKEQQKNPRNYLK